MPIPPLPRIVFLDRDSLPWPVRKPSLPHDWQEYPNTRPEQRLERLQGVTVAISNKVVMDRQLLLQLPQLKLIAVAATGVNLIDLDACRELDIAVSNIRHYADTTVAEHTMMLMLALRRNLMAYQQSVQAGEWQQSQQFCLMQHPVQDLAGSTLGIVGKGALGESVARLARAFGMNVLFAERRQARQLRPGYTLFDEVLQRADVLSLHCLLTDDTRHLIGSRELAQMKPGAILINTARGGLVDPAALAQALRQGRIGAAGIDTLETEPPRDGNPLLDTSLDRLIVTPHCAWLGSGALAALSEQLIGNIELFLQGTPRNRVA
jgi:glycerate dehydrogenase